MPCQHLEDCPFFTGRMAQMPRTSDLLKTRYCLHDFASCARFLVSDAVGHSRVPDNLFPNQLDKARDMLELA